LASASPEQREGKQSSPDKDQMGLANSAMNTFCQHFLLLQTKTGHGKASRDRYGVIHPNKTKTTTGLELAVVVRNQCV
jgi:hypothetical protein